MKQTIKNNITVMLCLCIAAFATSCNDDDKTEIGQDKTPTAKGLAFTKVTNQNLDSAYNNLLSALNANDAISVVAEVNHQQNASSASLNLNPTRLILFGNPKLGTPLMQANQQAGLDLPQKVLFYKNEAGEVYAAFNTAEYLASRHGVDTVTTLNQINTVLPKLVEDATGSKTQMPASQTVTLNEGVLSKVSKNSFAATYSKLQTAIQANPSLKIVAELDHQQNAKSVGMELRPTKLIVFGNPALGTPLMQAEQSIGIDLPQKILVYEDAKGVVRLTYNDPKYLAERHGVKIDDNTLDKIAAALNTLVTEAAE
jgi:uncharacterized protein (DUF302 family)